MDECPAAGKNSWPELKGKKGKEAKETIEKENKNVKAIVILDGTMVTQEIDCGRVRVWVDDCGIVVKVPTIG
ncbi:inhibitor of trypsin and hageman factor-like [Humulus lupulus]|uniref:inhibitor of trypsin and hageman factor-like n=1 Tax=Humulus lupulus TaxID=3486 RepID=UPI002B411737|nr:inhibitor of trypsin and hageman factor-like [Humulus lupulus]